MMENQMHTIAISVCVIASKNWSKSLLSMISAEMIRQRASNRPSQHGNDPNETLAITAKSQSAHLPGLLQSGSPELQSAQTKDLLEK